MGRGKWLDVDREEADEFLRHRHELTDDAVLMTSFRHKMRKSLPWEHLEKSTQTAGSTTGSARAGHGHNEGRPMPDLTIGETFRAIYREDRKNRGRARLRMFRGASKEEEAIERVRKLRQRHVNWFIQHFEYVVSEAPAIVDYRILGSDKSIFGLTFEQVLAGSSNATNRHPHITSTLEQFVLAAKLFTDMDRYEHRADVRFRFRNTLDDRVFEIGGGDCYLVHIPTMRRYGQSLSLLEQGERGPDDVAALAQRGIILNHPLTPPSIARHRARPDDEWVYVRAKQGPGTSDGLAFTLAGYLGGWGMSAAGRHFDNLDTWIKWTKDYEHGEFDQVITSMLHDGHPYVREILERYESDELSAVFTYLIAQDNSPSGTPFRQSTGMVPGLRRNHGLSEPDFVLIPLKDGVVPSYSPGFGSRYRLQLPIAAENLAAIGQSLPANSSIPTNWSGIPSSVLASEFEQRIRAVAEGQLPVPISDTVLSWILGLDRRTINHGTYRDRPVVSRHTMPLDLSRLGGSYE